MTDATPGASSPRPDPGRPPAGRRRAVLAAAMVLGGLLLGYLALYVWVGSGVPRGTSVAGVPIGGLTVSEATDRLEHRLGPRAASPITARAVDLTFRVRPHQAGLEFDPQATAESAGTRSWNPATLVAQALGREVDPVVVVDRARIDQTVARLADAVRRDPEQGGITFDGTRVVTIRPRAGMALDVGAARASLTEGYLVASAVRLPVTPVPPRVSEAEVRRVARGFARPAVSAPVVLTVAGHDFTVSPTTIARSLSFRPVAGSLVPHVDARVVRTALGDSLGALEAPPRDATFDVTSGSPVVVPSRSGRGVPASALSDALLQVLPRPTGRTASVSLAPIAPALTTTQAKQLGVRQVVSSFTQYFPYAAYRVTNIGLAARKIQGTLLAPGDTFSMNGVVGERTPENGFVKGYVIVGDRLVEDYGGAVSTITTAVWHTAWYAGMTRLESHAHAFWISRYEPGLEATVYWGQLDLRFRNDTPYGVYITTSVTDSSVTITFWSTRYWQIGAEFGPRENVTSPRTVYDGGPTCVPQDGVDGFDITVTRVWSRGGQVVRREPIRTSYAPEPNVICRAAPTPSTSVATTGKPTAVAKPTTPGRPTTTAKPSATG